MPQIKKSISKDLSFSVSPWQTKRGNTQMEADQTYTEVHLPFRQAHVDESADSSQVAATRSLLNRDTHEGGWKRRKKCGATTEISLQLEDPQPRAAREHSSENPEVDNDTTEWSESDDVSVAGLNGISLTGTAVLALLPDGHISGHLLDADSNTCFGIMGRQLTAERECTRDVEWKLLYVTIIDFRTNSEVSFPAERTAADAAIIQAPLQMHGEEQQVIEALQGHSSPKVELKIQCTTILVSQASDICRIQFSPSNPSKALVPECCSQDGGSADIFLATFNSKLCGKAAVVNKGTMKVHKLPFSQACHYSPQNIPTASHAQAAYDSDFDD